MNEALDFEAVARIARTVRLDAGTVRRVLNGEALPSLTPEQVAHVRALAAEALPRLPAARRVVNVNGRNAP
jgi:hypothetical protein